VALASDDSRDAASWLPVEAAAAAPTPPVGDKGIASRVGVTGKHFGNTGSQLKGQAKVRVQGVRPWH
jgi:hypothetical protein